MSDPDNDRTRLIRKSSAAQGGTPPPGPGGQDPEKTRYIEHPASEPPPGEDKTRILSRADKAPPPPPPPAESDHTKLVRPSSRSRGAAQAAEESEAGEVVGWLVVVKGPGRGRSVTLGYGQNTIGRDPGNRVVLPFGDECISRQKHAIVTYDPRGKKFYIHQSGDSPNMTYVGDAPVMSPVELKGGELIGLAENTVLKFVPLCGEDFDWEDDG